MKKIILTVLGTVTVLAATACSSTDHNDDAALPAAPTETRTAPDVSFLEENLPIVAGNLVVTVNNAREYGFEGENATSGGVYDVAQYYDDMTPGCQTKITRSEFRKDFLDRVVPLVADARPERVTATVDAGSFTAEARVEQVSGLTLVMHFEVEGSGEEFACNEGGTIAIEAAGGEAPQSTTTATVTVTHAPPAVVEPEPTAESCLAPGIPPEWDKNGDCLIDTDAPIG